MSYPDLPDRRMKPPRSDHRGHLPASHAGPAPVQQGRKIGFWGCTALVVGNVIGMGIFLLPASLAPYGFNTLIGWGVTVLGCLAIARVIAHLASALPGADGPYGYIRQSLGGFPAYVAMWAYWVSLWLTNAALATGVVGYMMVAFPTLRVIQPTVLALALQWLFVGVNLLGVRASGGVQIVTTILKLMPMVAIAAVGVAVLLLAPDSYTAHPPLTPVSLGGITAASTIALYAMLGIESASVPASRVEDPGRTIPRATIVGTVVTATIYIVVSTVPQLLIPQEQLGHASAPFALLMDRFIGIGFGRWLSLFVVVSGLGALNGWTLLAGEVTRTMASNGVLPTPFARCSRRNAPVLALLTTGVLASVMVWMNYDKSLVAAFTFLTRLVTTATLPLYLGCSLAIWVLWRRGAVRARALMAAAVGVLFVGFAFVGAGHEALLLGLALIAAGLPLYVAMRAWQRAHVD